MSLITRFNTAFAQKDWAAMNACYHPEARFDDPVFQDLDAREVQAMWKMLLSGGSEMRSTFRIIEENDIHGVCEWEAWYTFSKSGRAVHNIIRSEFEFRDGLIFRQRDRFNFWRWSRQALGVSGLVLGWSSLVRNKVRSAARVGLERTMKSA